MDIMAFVFEIYRRGRHILGLAKVKHGGQSEMEYSGKNRVIIFGTPNHGNLGDTAIAFAEEEFIKNIFPEATVYFIDETGYWKHRAFLRTKVSKKDLLILTGGGNMGSLYPYSEDLRRDVIKCFPDNKKIVFPQTIYFFDNIFGCYDKKKMRKLYNNDKNLYFFAREEYSYELMREMFSENRVFLVPDIVLLLKKLLPEETVRKGALICFRADEEAKLTKGDKERIYDKLSHMFNKVEITDTVVPYYNGVEESRKEIKEKLLQFAKAEVVVTDRLHGMVFAAITKTPCVAMSNYNKKVAGVFKWIAELSYVKYINDMSEFDYALNSVLNSEINAETVFNDICNKYESLYDVIKDI